MDSPNNACVISFNEMARRFSHSYLMCCKYIASTDAPRHIFTKKLYSKMVANSQVLEDFLDFHGAKNSREWFFYRELSAAVRHLALAAYSQKHILNRLVFYKLPDGKEFAVRGEQTLEFLNQCLRRLAPVILTEAEQLNIPFPDGTYQAANFPGISNGEMLPHDIDDEASHHELKKNIVKLTSNFLEIVDHFDQYAFYNPYSIQDILEIVPTRINEVEIRQFEMKVHNLQSYFDTYVIHGGFGPGDENLKSFRSYFSVVFHLLQLIGRLLHFYERHLHDAGFKNIYKNVQNNLNRLLDVEALLNCTVNYGLYYVCHYLTIGKEMAQILLNENMACSTITVGIPLERGFHCRPSLLVAKIVNKYGGKVELLVNGCRFDASSVLDIQWAGGKIAQENIRNVIFEGDERALKDIIILASCNYGEDIMGRGISLPEALKYLRE